MAGRTSWCLHARRCFIPKLRQGEPMRAPIPMLSGAGTAIVTPFTNSGDVDEQALRRFVAWQLEEGIDYIVPCGSTGEAATMTADEQRRVVEITVEVVAGRVPIIAGAGSNDTARAIAASRMMRDAGATHLLHASPAYNKPPQRGIIAHFRAIADAVDTPIVVYNVPGRTASNIAAETTLELAEHPNIVAVKEASGNLMQITEIIRHRPHGFAVLSGDDTITLAVMAAGGDGVKAAMAMLGMMENNLRLPLVPLAPQHNALVRAALVTVGAIAE